jgi:hypothetical protein
MAHIYRSPSQDRPHSPPSPTQTYHPSLFAGHIPTPALLESAAGGAHYSGAKIEHDIRRLRRGSSGRRSSFLEVKGDHKKVIEDLNELYCCRPTREILERRWRPDAVLEGPLCKCRGFDQYAAQWYAMSKLILKSETVSTRVLASTTSPNRLIYAQTQRYVLRFFKKKVTIQSIIVVDLDEDEMIIRLVDQWDGKEPPTRFGAHLLRVMSAKLIPWLVRVPAIPRSE